MSDPSRRPRALSFGETVIDIYPDRRVAAGSPLHLGAHLARRGWDVWLATRVGDDDDAAAIHAIVRRYGIAEALIETDPSLPTGCVTIRLHDGGHSFHIHKPAAWDALEMTGPPPEADLVCYGSLIGRSETSRATLFRLFDEGRFRMRLFDVNLRPPDVHLETLHRALRAATMLKVSDEELGQLGDLLDIASVEDFFAVAPDLEWIATTTGAEGAELVHRSGRSWRERAARVDVTDAVGAGDAFAAGLVDVLGRGGGGREALTTAIETAASILRQRGGLPADPEVRHRLH